MENFSLDFYDYLFLGLYLLSFAVLAFVARAKSLKTYWANDRSTGTFVLTLSIVSTIIGAGSIFAAASMAYMGGVTPFFLALGYALGLLGLGVMAPKLQKLAADHNLYSYPDFLELLFSRRCRYVGAITQFFVYFFYLAGQLIALSVICNLITGLPLAFSMAAAVLLVWGYTLLGGIKMDIIADNLQFYISLLLFIVLPLALIKNPEITNNVINLPSNFMAGVDVGGASFIIGMTITLFLGVLVSADNWMRIYSASTPKVARKAILASSVLVLLFVCFASLVGLVAKASLPDIDPNQAFLSVVQAYVPSGLLGLILAGLLAAILSSADSMLLITGMVVSEDAINLFLPKIKGDDRKTLFFTRGMNTGLLVLALVLALCMPDLVQIMINAASVLVILVPSVFMGLYAKRKNERAIFWSLLLGLIATIGGFIFMPQMPYIPGAVACYGTFFVLLFFPAKTSESKIV